MALLQLLYSVRRHVVAALSRSFSNDYRSCVGGRMTRVGADTKPTNGRLIDSQLLVSRASNYKRDLAQLLSSMRCRYYCSFVRQCLPLTSSHFRALLRRHPLPLLEVRSSMLLFHSLLCLVPSVDHLISVANVSSELVKARRRPIHWYSDVTEDHVANRHFVGIARLLGVNNWVRWMQKSEENKLLC